MGTSESKILQFEAGASQSTEKSPPEEIKLQLEEDTPQSRAKKFKRRLEKNLVSIYPPPETQVIKTRSRMPTKEAPQTLQTLTLSAKPVEEINESRVNASDGRTQILNPRKWPNSVHGLIAVKFKNDSCYGTGIMIGPNIVLTAGHNLYRFRDKTYADLASMQFLPGMNGHVLPFGSIEIEKYFLSPNSIQEEKEDYGILVLKEPVGELTGYFGLACLEPEEIKTKRINVTGYPGDKIAFKPNVYEMWGMEGEASHIDQVRGLISYMIDTDTGQSGSGVWYQEGEEFYVCGVHVLGTHFVNKATLLTRVIYHQIYMWVQQMKFKDSLLQLDDTKKLEFRDEEITAECIAILMDYKLEDLTILNLPGKKIDANGAKALAQNISWTNLSQLDLDSNKIGEEGAKTLAQNTSWTNLSHLNLSENDIGPRGAKALAQNTSWINLSQLNLFWNAIGAEGAKSLGQNTSCWINLSQLNLSENNIGVEGAKALAQNTSWVNLSQLKLSSNKIGEEGARALSQNISWIKLSLLDLSYNNITAGGAKALAQNTSWTSLSELNLEENNIGAEGAKALAQNTSWTNLSYLNSSKNNINAEGAIALLQNISWINLSFLNLYMNDINEEEIEVLEQNSNWMGLKTLYI